MNSINTTQALPLRLGLYGGSFDPIHEGHIALAKYAIDQLSLTGLLFIPVGNPPHRESLVANFDSRILLIRKALETSHLVQAEVCNVDAPFTQGELNYTSTLLKTMRDRFPTASLIWLMGADAFEKFDSWHEWQSITRLAHLAVFSRPNYSFEKNAWSPTLRSFWENHPHDMHTLLEQRSGGITCFDFPALPFSSETIREALYKRPKNLSLSEIKTLCTDSGLSEEVYQAICQYNLYPAKTRTL